MYDDYCFCDQDINNNLFSLDINCYNQYVQYQWVPCIFYGYIPIPCFFSVANSVKQEELAARATLPKNIEEDSKKIVRITFEDDIEDDSCAKEIYKKSEKSIDNKIVKENEESNVQGNIDEKLLLIKNISNIDDLFQELQEDHLASRKYTKFQKELIKLKYPHDVVYHNNRVKYLCKKIDDDVECKFSSYKSYSFREHINSHSGVKSHKCHICEKSFTQKGNCKKHAKIHLSQKIT